MVGRNGKMAAPMVAQETIRAVLGVHQRRSLTALVGHHGPPLWEVSPPGERPSKAASTPGYRRHPRGPPGQMQMGEISSLRIAQRWNYRTERRNRQRGHRRRRRRRETDRKLIVLLAPIGSERNASAEITTASCTDNTSASFD